MATQASVSITSSKNLLIKYINLDQTKAIRLETNENEHKFQEGKE